MVELRRRSFIGYGIAGITAMLSPFARATELFHPTPAETEGPFYPVRAQKDRDFDLTRVEGQTGSAQGTVIFVEGRVLDTSGNPVSDATVDLWQTNAVGRYRHPDESSRNPLDPNFQGWAIVPSGRDGGFRFKTVFPGAYSAGRGWARPPHIHFKITKPGFRQLTTQMYFPGHPLNEKDYLLRRKSEAERKLMIASLAGGDPPMYRWQVVLWQV
jgi:protocatechuate 3,4-dioxygenase beta subunit